MSYIGRANNKTKSKHNVVQYLNGYFEPHCNGFLPDESIIWMSSLSDVELKANDVDETMVGVNMTSLLPFVVEKQSEQEKKLV